MSFSFSRIVYVIDYKFIGDDVLKRSFFNFLISFLIENNEKSVTILHRKFPQNRFVERKKKKKINYYHWPRIEYNWHQNPIRRA